MDRMKRFILYFILLIAFYFISNFLIDAYIQSSYRNIKKYDINVNEATVTIMTAKSSKDDGYIEGKFYNSTDNLITDKHLKIDLFSQNDVKLGTEYVLVRGVKSGELKDFKVTFKYGNVSYFNITMISDEEKQAIEQEKQNEKLIKYNLGTNQDADKILDGLDKNQNIIK